MKSKRMKSLISFVLSITILSLLVTVPSFAQNKLDNKTLISIGQEDITVKEFIDVFKKNNLNNEILDKKSLEEYLDLYVNFRLKVAEAKAMKMDTNKAFIEELAGYRTQLSKPYFTNEKVTEQLLEEAYQRKLKDIRASHILVNLVKDPLPKDTLAAYNKIMKIRERILSGESFGEIASKESDDPSARDREAVPNQRPFRPGNKGDLGYFSVFDMVYPFENGAYTTPVGNLSMPVRSDFGYHLIKVTEISDAVGSIEAAHIYVAVNPGATDEEVAEKDAKIKKIYAKIEEGSSFEEAVVQYSEDRGSATREGKLAKFTANRIVPEFVETIKKMKPGEVSAPIRTMYGFHIIKLIGLEKPADFETEKAALKERIAKDGRAKKSEEAVINQIKKETKFKLNEKNASAFISKLDSTVVAGNFDSQSYTSYKKPLFKLGKKSITQADFVTYIAKNKQKQEGISPEAYGYKLLNEFVNKQLIMYEDSRLEKKYPEFASLMKEYHDGILLFDLMDKKVWSYAVKDTTGLQEFYQNNRSEYLWGERVDATVYTVTKAEDVAKVKQIIASQPDDGAIAQAFDRDSIISVRIQPGKFERGDNKFVDMVEWNVGSLTEKYSDVDNFTVLVKIREKFQPEPKALDEARGIITSDYQNYLEKMWVKELKQKYPVVIHRELLDEIKSNY
jgi:peptidyl-prolyl cis-trans isomerase SurA